MTEIFILLISNPKIQMSRIDTPVTIPLMTAAPERAVYLRYSTLGSYHICLELYRG